MGKVILHIPHSSMLIPDYIRKDILLIDSELKEEMELITDLYTDLIFNGKDVVKFEFSRFVCDVERFEDDKLETMAKLGMGAVYLKIPSGKELRYFDNVKRKHIMDNYYKIHHARLEAMVNDKLDKHNECFILDCHSFNPNTNYVQMQGVPDICIGVDNYHTSAKTKDDAISIFQSLGYSVRINNPFSGSIVPMNYYNKDKRVKSMMIELNRRIYIKGRTEIDEEGMQRVTSACNQVIDSVENE
ncbi:N-formylglutamate amidohydrolase [Clostridium drakei]|uniref:N-formylglutamate amidohydrolase n=1 Tax=Clostridium drakei TaxID=332101 RepID=A0A2U8DWJ7_9CLOT|nr:N-formylglutamate amidohydrolase [Clostridium drakei]AWI06765.1 hypothetical protein B9W14_20440 [Clostridium drakei]